MAKKKAEEQLNLDSILFKCRDYLRAARNGTLLPGNKMLVSKGSKISITSNLLNQKRQGDMEKLRQQ